MASEFKFRKMTLISKSKIPRTVFILSILTFIFWCLTSLLDVYNFTLIGVVFEILWFPMIVLLIFLPIISMIFLVKENLKLKSFYFYSKSNLTSLSDDSGFIIDGSENFPGVKTARYAKENGGITGAIKKLFQEYNEKETIPITFHCSLSYKSHDREISATGSVKGNLINTSAGDNGFGYDPYFIPINNNKTFAEMETEQKLLHSHRFYAFQDLALKIN